MIRRKLISDAASSLLHRGGITQPPVDVERLAIIEGAVVIKEPTDNDTSGFIYQAPGVPAVIGINSNHSPVRRRFTIAHELGHLVLHSKSELHIDHSVVRMRDKRASEGIDEDEMEANRFAAEVLMPEAFLRADLQKLGLHTAADDGEAISALARKYQVSVQAMTIRLTSLNLVGM